MPFGAKLKGYLNKAEAEVEKYRQGRLNAGGHLQANVGDSGQSDPRTAYWALQVGDGAAVNQHFRHECGQHGWGNNEAQNYTDSPENSFFGPDGSVHVVAIINNGEQDNARKFTSARLSSHQTLGRVRGSLSAHITAPSAGGIWPAFWLLPQDPFKWPTDGEIDICELWNGDKTNHSCLHWGMFDGPDHDKHRVIKTPIPRIDQPEGVRYDFAWDEGSGRLVWYMDGRPVMKAQKPGGTRPMRDFRILINIAVGGNVNQGAMPGDGRYEMVVKDLKMSDDPPGGWQRFEQDHGGAAEGGPS